MNRTRSSPRREHAYRWLCGRVATMGVGSRLPTVRVLCAEAGVSLVTMWKAVGRLRDDGALAVIPRGGIVVQRSMGTCAPAERAVVPSAPSAWRNRTERVATTIRNDILRRALRPGERLASVKLLAARYGAGVVTVRHACDQLCAQELLTREHRGWIVSPFDTTSPSAKIVILARAAGRADLAVMTPWASQVWRELDAAMWRGRISFSCHAFPSAIAGERSAASALSDPLLLGVIVLGLGLSAGETTPLFHVLERTGRPVAVLDESEDFGLRRSVAAFERGRVFLLGCGEACGRALGTYLLRKGTNRAAAIPPMTEITWPWIASRCAGIRAAIPEPLPLLHLPRDVSGDALESYVRSDSRNAMFFSALDTLARDTERSFAVVDRPMAARTVPDYLRLRAHRALLAEPLARLYEDTSIDTWIGLNDNMALVALDFVQSRRKRRGRAIRVAGFDDSDMAHANELTSYNWNVGAVVQAMVDFVLANPRGRHLQTSSPVEIPGFVVERASTR